MQPVIAENRARVKRFVAQLENSDFTEALIQFFAHYGFPSQPNALDQSFGNYKFHWTKFSSAKSTDGAQKFHAVGAAMDANRHDAHDGYALFQTVIDELEHGRKFVSATQREQLVAELRSIDECAARYRRERAGSPQFYLTGQLGSQWADSDLWELPSRELGDALGLVRLRKEDGGRPLGEHMNKLAYYVKSDMAWRLRSEVATGLSVSKRAALLEELFVW